MSGWWLFLGLAVLLVPLAGTAFGLFRGLCCALAIAAGAAGIWQLGQLTADPRADTDVPVPYLSVPSETCQKCHEDHYASWFRTYHRTMTREATPEYVKGDFAEASYSFQGVTSRMTREGHSYFMETLDRATPRSTGPLKKLTVDRLVGSHWFQECMHRDEAGRYWRLPISYHIVEQRWVHTNGAFLAPDTPDFWSKSTIWNESCLFCHNTKPRKQPIRQARGVAGYETEVAELGIACEACHGPGGEHIRVNQNPARRYALHETGAADPSIVNPRRLPVRRADDICAHCHGGLVPRPEAWDPVSVADPFNAGEDIGRSFHFYWSEKEQALRYANRQPDPRRPLRPAPDDGRFWGDGTPLTTAVEYQGMARSACYENGQGRLSCVTCHSLHDSPPNFLLRQGMETNEACYQCHPGYRERLVEHTHHPAGSSGSLCYNCHMPYVVYSLLTTHRSHRIESLRVRDSRGTGKPHACNLCHLDQSLGWTQDRLQAWYGRAPEPLTDEERRYASSLLLWCRSDARTRAVVAGAYSSPAALEASGRDWPARFLVRFLEEERYPAVRYLAQRSLRRLIGSDAEAYDYLASPAQRRAQVLQLTDRLGPGPRLDPRRHPGLPLDPQGQPQLDEIDRLRRERHDPDITIHE